MVWNFILKNAKLNKKTCFYCVQYCLPIHLFMQSILKFSIDDFDGHLFNKNGNYRVKIDVPTQRRRSFQSVTCRNSIAVRPYMWEVKKTSHLTRVRPHKWKKDVCYVNFKHDSRNSAHGSTSKTHLSDKNYHPS